jgi:glycosyltransferase involved in cell wall biosynthesis
MSVKILIKKNLRLHLTNVTGLGSTQLLKSLLPELEKNANVNISEIYLPGSGSLSNFVKLRNASITQYNRRYIPNALSRLLECVFFSSSLNSIDPILVLGDLPLRCKCPQTVFVQTSHLLKQNFSPLSFHGIKFAISRLVFRLNAKYAQAFIVQTSLMKTALKFSYPSISNKIHVIPQPVPYWLINFKPRIHGPSNFSKRGLRLIYPAAGYPHKNHLLLSKIKSDLDLTWPVESLKLTLPLGKNPSPGISWIQCVDFLSPDKMIEAYNNVDGLVFLSTDESYGFPLVEAMFVGLPIICPDLPYAHTLCLDEAIYFDPHSVFSLHEAIETLHLRILSGWWPNWTKQLKSIPKDWNEVAEAMVKVACEY